MKKTKDANFLDVFTDLLKQNLPLIHKARVTNTLLANTAVVSISLLLATKYKVKRCWSCMRIAGALNKCFLIGKAEALILNAAILATAND